MKFYYIPFFICIGVVFTKCQSHVRDNNNDAHSKDNQYEKKVTIQDVDRGIRLNIDSKIKEGGGYFTFKNSDSTQLRLKLVRVHTEYLSVLGSHEFFACVDLATANGDVYDVDFFLKGNADHMKVTKTNIHA